MKPKRQPRDAIELLQAHFDQLCRVRPGRTSSSTGVVQKWCVYGYYKAHVRTLFHHLGQWIVRRLRSHRFKRWRCCGWKVLPDAKLRGEMGLVSLISLIPYYGSPATAAFVKAVCGKTARTV